MAFQRDGMKKMQQLLLKIIDLLLVYLELNKSPKNHMHVGTEWRCIVQWSVHILVSLLQVSYHLDQFFLLYQTKISSIYCLRQGNEL
jgi:hypothetical protein